MINYAVPPVDPSTLVFLSDEAPGTPRFRLTYVMSGDRGSVVFEIAPPGSSEFQKYVEGKLQRQ